MIITRTHMQLLILEPANLWPDLICCRKAARDGRSSDTAVKPRTYRQFALFPPGVGVLPYIMDNRKTSFYYPCLYGLFATCTYTIIFPPPPPMRPPRSQKILHCFQFLLTALISGRNEKQRLCLKFWWANKVHYRRCANGLYWDVALDRVWFSSSLWKESSYISSE